MNFELREVFLKSRALYLERKQKDIPCIDWDYGFADFYRDAYQCEKADDLKESFWLDWQNAEAIRNYYTGSVSEIKHLIQFDETPCDLKEAKCDLYKISFSYRFVGL